MPRDDVIRKFQREMNQSAARAANDAAGRLTGAQPGQSYGGLFFDSAGHLIGGTLSAGGLTPVLIAEVGSDTAHKELPAGVANTIIDFDLDRYDPLGGMTPGASWSYTMGGYGIWIVGVDLRLIANGAWTPGSDSLTVRIGIGGTGVGLGGTHYKTFSHFDVGSGDDLDVPTVWHWAERDVPGTIIVRAEHTHANDQPIAERYTRILIAHFAL